jgi:hypothetical protein
LAKIEACSADPDKSREKLRCLCQSRQNRPKSEISVPTNSARIGTGILVNCRGSYSRRLSRGILAKKEKPQLCSTLRASIGCFILSTDIPLEFGHIILHTNQRRRHLRRSNSSKLNSRNKPTRTEIIRVDDGGDCINHLWRSFCEF